MPLKPFTVNTEIALLSKHGKVQQIAPLFAEHFDATVRNTDAFDTDCLGSFDGSIERTLSPVQAALKKAYIACELTSLKQGLGSEGSFQSHISGATMNSEIVAFVDVSSGHEIVGFAQEFMSLGALSLADESEFTAKYPSMINAYGPDQKWMVLHHAAPQESHLNTSKKSPSSKVIKGLANTEILANIAHWPASIEPDFRAMYCPLRQKTIKLATGKLIENIKSTCPKCDAPNFVPQHNKVKTDKDNLSVKNSYSQVYLSCEACGSTTTQLAPAMPHCDECHFTQPRDQDVGSAPAFYCTVCNP